MTAGLLPGRSAFSPRPSVIAEITHHPPLMAAACWEPAMCTSLSQAGENENILFAQKPHIAHAELLSHQRGGAHVGQRLLQLELTARGTRSLLLQTSLILKRHA